METDTFRLIAALLLAMYAAGCGRQGKPAPYADAPVGSYSPLQATGYTTAQDPSSCDDIPSWDAIRRLPAADRNSGTVVLFSRSPKPKPTTTNRSPELTGRTRFRADHATAILPVPEAENIDPRELLSGKFDFDHSMAAVDETPEGDPGLSTQQLERLRVPIEVARRASRMLRDGNRLSERGATFAAEREFHNALRLITQSLDAQIGKQYHAKALNRAIRALEEADDFSMVSQDQPSHGVHLSGFITGHLTPVLKRADAKGLTAMVATQRYHEYAYQQLTTAGGRDPLASEALFACGQIIAIQDAESPSELIGSPKCIPFLQAALTVNGSNARAANELGIVFARRGRLREAIHVFEFSARVAPTPLVLANLADAQTRVGNAAAARRIRQQLNQVNVGPTSNRESKSNIVWVAPEAFKRLGSIPTASEIQAVKRFSDQLMARKTANEQPKTTSSPTSRPRMAARPNPNWMW